MGKTSAWRLFGLAVILAAGPAMAADKPGKDSTKRLQQQLRMAEQQKSELEQAKADAEGKLKEAQDKAADIERRAEDASHRSGQLKKELETLHAEKDKLAADSKADHEALSDRLAGAERKLAELKQAYDRDKQQWGADSAQLTSMLNGCRDRNERMYTLGNELIDLYEHKGCFTSLLQAEPVTGLKRAQIEKMTEEDREKFEKDQLPQIPKPPPIRDFDIPDSTHQALW